MVLKNSKKRKEDNFLVQEKEETPNVCFRKQLTTNN